MMVEDTVEKIGTAGKNGKTLIRLRDVGKRFRTEAGDFTALSDINLSVEAGEFVFIVGRSGSGKSTLLNLISRIDRPSEGEVIVGGVPVHSLSEERAAVFRGRSVGIVFQFFQLLPTLSILENVLLPMDFANVIPTGVRLDRAIGLLKSVGIANHARKLPNALSGGELQRAAIARALANDPAIVVADEPTGNLDSGTAASVFELFAELARGGKTVLIVTHERTSLPAADRILELADGRILNERVRARLQETQGGESV